MKRRKFNIFSLSFLDCICCGFGAVVLLFVLMNARASASREEIHKDLRGEVLKWERLVEKGKRDRVQARNSLDEVIDELAKTEGLTKQVLENLQIVINQLAKLDGDTLAKKEHVNKLKTDIKSLEEGIKRLKAGAEQVEEGDALVAFAGDGQRQYLTGLNLEGERTLILVDRSTSMLSSKVIDILRMRNLPEADRRKAEKWTQNVKTVEWLLARLPETGTFHVALYNEKTVPLAEKAGWQSSGDAEIRKELIEAMKEETPGGSTSLENAFVYAAKLSPQPDNIILLGDGLPTMGKSRPLGNKVSGNTRWRYFNNAVKERPRGVPIHTILFGMEGDPMAAVGYWRLAAASNGSFITASKDWP